MRCEAECACEEERFSWLVLAVRSDRAVPRRGVAVPWRGVSNPLAPMMKSNEIQECNEIK